MSIRMLPPVGYIAGAPGHNPESEPDMGKHHQILKEHEELDRRIGMAIRRLTDHIKRLDDGTFLLNVTDGAALEIDAITFADLRRSLEETNRKIKAGVLKKEDISWP